MVILNKLVVVVNFLIHVYHINVQWYIYSEDTLMIKVSVP